MIVGLLLAAGSGSRLGRPKALVVDDSGVPWVVSARKKMLAAGCEKVLTVIGAASAEVQKLVPDEFVVAGDWEQGMSASLRAGLTELLSEPQSTLAALVHLVDLPDVGVDAMERVAKDALLDAALSGVDPQNVLARATYKGEPGHPVLIGRKHWQPLLAEITGDKGARDYLVANEATAVECGDLATGLDVDTDLSGL